MIWKIFCLTDTEIVTLLFSGTMISKTFNTELLHSDVNSSVIRFHFLRLFCSLPNPGLKITAVGKQTA